MSQSIEMSRSAMVIAGRGARACDACGTERARWYCAADEAYLCERCDGSVHSANLVARRHERVGLGPNGAPLKIDRKRSDSSVHRNANLPAKKWQRSRKKRSESSSFLFRHGMSHPLGVPTSRTAAETACLMLHPKPELAEAPLVPKGDEDVPLLSLDHLGEEIIKATLANTVKREPSSPAHDYQSVDRIAMDLFDFRSEDSQLAQQVPTYEPLLCQTIATSHGEIMQEHLPTSHSLCNDIRSSVGNELVKEAGHCKVEENSDFTAKEPAELEVGVIEEGSISIDDVSDIDALDSMNLSSDHQEVPNIELWRAAFKTNGERQLEAQHELALVSMKLEPEEDPSQSMDPSYSEQPRKLAQDLPAFRKTLSLQLNYEEVLTAWSDRGSLWMDGWRPQIVPDDSFFDTGRLDTGPFPESSCNSSQTGEQANCQVSVTDGGGLNAGIAREARVNRYREKRRTRLFSKKIRYEVRKLNAERRPRMRGRFVKRCTLTEM